MLISQLSKASYLSKDTIRHYESLGLIKSTPRPAGSRVYREYSTDTVERLALIVKGKMLGYGLREMQPWLDLFMDGSLSKDKIVELTTTKISEIDRKQAELQKMKSELMKKLELIQKKQT